MFDKDGLKKTFIKFLYKMSCKNAIETWFLNQDDKNFFEKNKLISPRKSKLLYGEGINLSKFVRMKKIDYKNGINVIMISRLLIEKGVYEFCEAAKYFKIKKSININFSLLGPFDKLNPKSLKLRYNGIYR